MTDLCMTDFGFDLVPPLISRVYLMPQNNSLEGARAKLNRANQHLSRGALGPWVIATESGRVISICHTALPLTPQSAECGVWTDPGFRGRGYTATVTAEWAAMLKAPGRVLFYSTDVENLSSQRVAQRLRLPVIGWTWRLTKDEPTNPIHPLSQLRLGPR